MSSYVALSTWDLLLASGFIILNAALSLALQLGLHRTIIISAARMIIQLMLVGLVLKAVFAAQSPWITTLIGLIMVGFAAREIRARQERPLTGVWGYTLGGGAMVAAGATVTIFALAALIKPAPWWSAQFALPLFGMILGNTMTGISLGLNALHTMMSREQRAIEAQLMLGKQPRVAFRPAIRHALRAGFTPIINAMAATGVVSLPGMMTGQILAGVDPQEAVKYQLLIMFLIGGATGLGVIGAVFASAWRLTDHRQRLRLDRLLAKST